MIEHMVYNYNKGNKRPYLNAKKMACFQPSFLRSDSRSLPSAPPG